MYYSSLAESHFHLIVTSPPYNVGTSYPDWNDSLPVDKYFSFCQQWMRECYRVLVKGGRLCLNIPLFGRPKYKRMQFRYLSVLWKVGFTDREVIVWVKKQKSNNHFICKRKLFGSIASPSNPHIRTVAELILVMKKESRRLSGDSKKADITREEYAAWTKNVWEIETELDRRHPAPFPYELPRRLIKLYSYRENRILDPFLGRGTTLKVASQLGRHAVGIELSPEYLALIRETVGEDLTVKNFKHRKEQPQWQTKPNAGYIHPELART